MTQETENNVNPSENSQTINSFIVKDLNNNSQNLKKITDSEQPILKGDNNLKGHKVDLNNKKLQLSEATVGYVTNDLKDNKNNKEWNKEKNIDEIIGIYLQKKRKEINDYDIYSFKMELLKLNNIDKKEGEEIGKNNFDN